MFEFDENIALLIEDVVEVETPRLIGCLNREFGFIGYDPIPFGTPVYELRDRYFFNRTMTSSKVTNRSVYYKKTLESSINFL